VYPLAFEFEPFAVETIVQELPLSCGLQLQKKRIKIFPFIIVDLIDVETCYLLLFYEMTFGTIRSLSFFVLTPPHLSVLLSSI